MVLMITLIRRQCGEGREAMDELVGRLVASIGIDPGVAEKAVGIILAFLLKEGPADKVQALIDQGVIGDFRSPDFMRFGFAPLYLSYSDVYAAATILHDILANGVWRAQRFANRGPVT